MYYCNNCREIIDNLSLPCPFCLHYSQIVSPVKYLSSLPLKLSSGSLSTTAAPSTTTTTTGSRLIPSQRPVTTSSSTRTTTRNSLRSIPSSTTKQVGKVSQNSLDNSIDAYDSPPLTIKQRSKQAYYSIQSSSEPIDLSQNQDDEEEDEDNYHEQLTQHILPPYKSTITTTTVNVANNLGKRKYSESDSNTHYSQHHPSRNGSSSSSSSSSSTTNSRSATTYPNRTAIVASPSSSSSVHLQMMKPAKKLQKQQQMDNRLREFQNRVERGGYAVHEIGCIYSQEFWNHPLLNAIQGIIVSKKEGILLPDTDIDNPIPYSFHWCRGKVNYPTPDDSATSHRAVPPVSSKDVDFSPSSRNMEPFVAIVYDGSEYISLLLEKNYEGLYQLFESYKQQYPADTHFIIVIIGLESSLSHHNRNEMHNKRTKSKSSSSSNTSSSSSSTVISSSSHTTTSLTRDTIELINNHIWIGLNINFRLIDTLQETADYLFRLTSAIGKRPYSLQPTALACSVKVRVPKAKPEFIHEKRKTDTGVWWAMLQSVPGISEAIASAIVSRYPTLSSLMQAYQNPNFTEFEKIHLLDTLPNVKRKLSKISRTVYQFFMCTDPDEKIGV